MSPEDQQTYWNRMRINRRGQENIGEPEQDMDMNDAEVPPAHHQAPEAGNEGAFDYSQFSEQLAHIMSTQERFQATQEIWVGNQERLMESHARVIGNQERMMASHEKMDKFMSDMAIHFGWPPQDPGVDDMGDDEHQEAP